MISVDAYPQWQPHVGMIQGRLSQELRKVNIEINEEKTKVVDFGAGGSFEFLGFDLRAEAIVSAGHSFCAFREEEAERADQVGRILKY